MDESLPRARTTFAALVGRRSASIPLAESALLIAAEEYPGLNVGEYLARLDVLADGIREAVDNAEDPRAAGALLTRFLYESEGFRGNAEDYYDPRNSFLNDVIDRRVGIPISLSIVYISVGTRLGLPLSGVSFPRHFAVTYRASPDPLFLDAFNQGRLLRDSDFRLLFLEQFGPEARFDPAVLRPATPHEIIARLLRNLTYIYVAQEDFPRAVRCSERLLYVTALPADRRDLGMLLARDGRLRDAVPHLERYLAEVPEAADRAQVEANLTRLQQALKRLN